MAERDTRVIGYFARTSPTQVVCTDNDACLVTGSDEAMAQYLAELPADARGAVISKTRFGEIIMGLQLGAAYSFDQQSYSRFYPLAQAVGLPVQPAEFDAERGLRFFTVRLRVR